MQIQRRCIPRKLLLCKYSRRDIYFHFSAREFPTRELTRVLFIYYNSVTNHLPNVTTNWIATKAFTCATMVTKSLALKGRRAHDCWRIAHGHPVYPLACLLRRSTTHTHTYTHTTHAATRVHTCDDTSYRESKRDDRSVAQRDARARSRQIESSRLLPAASLPLLPSVEA